MEKGGDRWGAERKRKTGTEGKEIAYTAYYKQTKSNLNRQTGSSWTVGHTQANKQTDGQTHTNRKRQTNRHTDPKIILENRYTKERKNYTESGDGSIENIK